MGCFTACCCGEARLRRMELVGPPILVIVSRRERAAQVDVMDMGKVREGCDFDQHFVEPVHELTDVALVVPGAMRRPDPRTVRGTRLTIVSFGSLDA